MTVDKKQIGERGETDAAEFLAGRGYAIVERNFEFQKGEIDIVCRAPDGTLVFAEVRATLAHKPLGDPETWFTGRKRAQLRKMAQNYLYARRLGDIPCRIDFLAVELGAFDSTIRHYPNAVGF